MAEWSREVSLGREHLSNDLKELREGAMWTSGTRAFRAEGTARAKVLRQDRVWHIGDLVWSPSLAAHPL